MIPRILIVDDLYGRVLKGRTNPDREAFCGKYMLVDVSIGAVRTSRIKRPVARATFLRGQKPECSQVGDFVENDLQSVIEMVRSNWVDLSDIREAFSLALLDLSFKTGRVTAESDADTTGMPEGRETDDDASRYFGMTILKELNRLFPDLPVVILSSKPEDDVKDRYSEMDARGFLEKSDGNAEALERLIREEGLIPDDSGSMIGFSRRLLIALREARNSALVEENVHIHGERGSGKELLARYIHRYTFGAAARPFVTVDCGALSTELYASTLFGQTKGAFTGAIETKRGRIAEANGGDVFLDEIANMPAAVQEGILRATDEKLITPVGGKPEPVEVRFISATNAILETAVERGGFRPDLLDRLCKGGLINLPPLRDRLEDLPFLVELFVREAEAAANARAREIRPETLSRLSEYNWPGNVRELRNQIFRAVQHHRRLPALIPDHFRLPPQSCIPIKGWEAGRKQVSEKSETGDLKRPSIPESQYQAVATARASIEDLIMQIERFDFSTLAETDLPGRFDPINDAIARLLVRYLKACLEATKRRSPSSPNGEIVVQRAIRLLTGEETLKSYQAYDVIRRIVRLAPHAVEDFLEDSNLNAAYEMARRRGRRTGKKQDDRQLS